MAKWTLLAYNTFYKILNHSHWHLPWWTSMIVVYLCQLASVVATNKFPNPTTDTTIHSWLGLGCVSVKKSLLRQHPGTYVSLPCFCFLVSVIISGNKTAQKVSWFCRQIYVYYNKCKSFKIWINGATIGFGRSLEEMRQNWTHACDIAYKFDMGLSYCGSNKTNTNDSWYKIKNKLMTKQAIISWLGGVSMSMERKPVSCLSCITMECYFEVEPKTNVHVGHVMDQKNPWLKNEALANQ